MESLIKQIAEAWRQLVINCFKLWVFIKEKIQSIIKIFKDSRKSKNKKN